MRLPVAGVPPVPGQLGDESAIRVGLHVEDVGKAPVQPAPLPGSNESYSASRTRSWRNRYPSPSATSNTRLTASRSAVSSSMPSRSTTSASRRCSTAPPNTDAVPSAWRAAGESCSTPAMTTSLRAAGTTVRSSAARSSSAKNGFPPASRSTALSRSAGTAAPRMSAAITARAARSSPPSSTRRTLAPRASSAANVRSTPSVPSRVRPARAHEQNGALAKIAGEMIDDTQRRVIGPLDVLDDEHHAGAARYGRHLLEDRLEHPGPAQFACIGPRRHRRDAGDPGAGAVPAPARRRRPRGPGCGARSRPP